MAHGNSVIDGAADVGIPDIVAFGFESFDDDLAELVEVGVTRDLSGIGIDDGDEFFGAVFEAIDDTGGHHQ